MEQQGLRAGPARAAAMPSGGWLLPGMKWRGAEPFERSLGKDRVFSCILSDNDEESSEDYRMELEAWEKAHSWD